MLDSKYLYDTNINEYAELPYNRVLFIKIHLAKNLLKRLVTTDNMNDTQRMAEVHKAIEFNKALLKEIGFDEKSISLALKAIEEELN